MYLCIDIYDSGIFLRTRIESEDLWQKSLVGSWQYMLRAGEWNIYRSTSNHDIMAKVRTATENEVKVARELHEII